MKIVGVLGPAHLVPARPSSPLQPAQQAGGRTQPEPSPRLSSRLRRRDESSRRRREEETPGREEGTQGCGIGGGGGKMVKARMTTTDVAAEVKCLRRLIGMRLANVYDITPKVTLTPSLESLAAPRTLATASDACPRGGGVAGNPPSDGEGASLLLWSPPRSGEANLYWIWDCLDLFSEAVCSCSKF